MNDLVHTKQTLDAIHCPYEVVEGDEAKVLADVPYPLPNPVHLILKVGRALFGFDQVGNFLGLGTQAGLWTDVVLRNPLLRESE